MTADLLNFAVALLIGVLVGIDREQKKAREHASGIGGIRTFALIALAGAASAKIAEVLQSPWVIFAGIVAVAASVIASFVAEVRRDPSAHGLTTEIAGLVVFLLGALAIAGNRDLAVILGIVTSAILAYKQPLHSFVGKIGQDDLYAILKLLIATFIVLPILPNRTVDPWGAINPYKVWWLVILISGLSLIGYVATRWLGRERGTSITGFFGGLVSSTAVTLTFARQSREKTTQPPSAFAAALICGILLAWTVMFGRVIIEVLVVYPPLLRTTAIRMGVMGSATALIAGLFYVASRHQSSKGDDVPLKNPFSLVSAAKFAAFFTLILVLVKLVQVYLPGRGVYAVAALAGLTDVDAITLSMAEQARDTGQTTVAVNAITIAAMTNTATKAAIVALLGASAMRWRILLATSLILAAGAATFLLK